METIFGLTIAIVILPVVVFFVVRAVRQERIREKGRLALWRRFASERGFRLHLPPGPWYRRPTHAVEGRLWNIPFRLDTDVLSTGETHVTYTRVRGELDRPFPGRLEVSRRNFLAKLAEKLGRRSLRTGDPAFDAAMTARSKSGGSALGVLDENVRSRLSSFPRRATLRVSGGEVTVRWLGAEEDFTVMESGCELMAAAVRACAKI